MTQSQFTNWRGISLPRTIPSYCCLNCFLPSWLSTLLELEVSKLYKMRCLFCCFFFSWAQGWACCLPFPRQREMMLISENPGSSRKQAASTPGSKFMSPHGSFCCCWGGGREGGMISVFRAKKKHQTLERITGLPSPAPCRCPSIPPPQSYTNP